MTATIATPKGSRLAKNGSRSTPPPSVGITDDTIRRLTNVFSLLADPNRLKIVLALSQEDEMHVSALCDLLGQSQPAVSHHLTLMRRTGLVGYRRDGKHNFYHLDSGFLREILEQFFADSGNGPKQLHLQEFSLAYKRK